jgi:hypothetical protein
MTDEPPQRRLSIGRVLAGVVAVVTIVGGLVALVFTVKPGWKPCLVSARASISASVLPGAHGSASSSGAPYGADVVYLVTADDYRGKTLMIRYSLLRVARDGTLGSVVGLDRQPGDTVRVSSCSDRGGNDFPIAIPESGQRYRVVLELFPSTSPGAVLLDVTETPIFRVEPRRQRS